MTLEWINTLVEVSVTLYIFLLGLPTILYQVFIPEDLRRFSYRILPRKQFVILLIPLLLLVSFYILLGNEVFTKKITTGSSLHTSINSLVYISFIGLLGVSSIIIIRSLFQTRSIREIIVKSLGSELISVYGNSPQKTIELLDDLAYLGKYSQAGRRTQMVVEELDAFTDQVLKVPTYNGYELEKTIEILCDCVTHTPNAGSANNMLEVIRVYRKMISKIKAKSTKNEWMNFSDVKRINYFLTHHMIDIAFEKKRDMVIHDAIQLISRTSLSTTTAQTLFKIGLTSIRKNKYDFVLKVLNIMEDNLDKQSEVTDNYLGLLAHLWQDGPTAQSVAKRSLTFHIPQDLESLNEHLINAANYHKSIANFITADKLLFIQKALTTPPTSSFSKTAPKPSTTTSLEIFKETPVKEDPLKNVWQSTLNFFSKLTAKEEEEDEY